MGSSSYPIHEEARDRLDTFRTYVREWEAGAEGLLLSYVGKLPGLAIRLSLVLSYLDWARGIEVEAHTVTAGEFDRATRFIETYAYPMAQRAYAGASPSKTERAAFRLVALIREQGWERFTSREILRLDRSGLGTAAELNPALKALEEADVIKGLESPVSPNGGRRARLFAVNPAIHQASG